MQFGIALPNFSRLGTREAVVEIARAAEELGYDALWTTDHVMMAKGQDDPYGHILEAMTTLTYVAALTERVRLGVSVIVLPMREPVLFAKQVATLDTLSGGRVIMGVGAGWNEREFGFLGANFEDRGKRYDEYIRVLRELWTSPEPRFEGQYVKFSDVLFSPRSPQSGGPKIVIGGGSGAALRRSATLADGWHATGLTPEKFAEGAGRVRELAGGRQVELQVRLHTRVGEVLPDVHSAAGAVQKTLSGSVEEVVADIEAYKAAGLTHLVSNFGGESAAAFVAQMRRFAEEVRPRVA
jgi:probable F420-dependent oxidoreductase